jgi:glycosyltransferase involved in cell wall biosynthesis
VPSARPSTPQPRVTIFLEQFTGHRLWYVRLLCDALVQTQRQVSVQLPDAARAHPALREHLAGLPDDRVTVDFYRSTAHRRLRSILRQDREVVLPDGDKHLAQVVGSLVVARLAGFVGRGSRPGRVRLLLLRHTPGTSARSRLVFRAKLLLEVVCARTLSTVSVGTLVMDAEAPHQGPVVPVLDPTVFRCGPGDTRESARAALSLPADETLVSIAGAITARKNYRSALAGVLRSRGSIRLLLVGQLDDAARAFIASLDPPSRSAVLLRDEYLSDADLDRYILASDAVLALYANTGSSGIVLKAAAAGTPVVGSAGNSEVEAFITKHRAGVITPSLSSDDVSTAIEDALAAPPRAARAVDSGPAFARQLLGAP